MGGESSAELLEFPEDEVKAALLLNFALYTEWPDRDPGSDFHICLAGVSDPASFHGVLSHQIVGEEPVRVQRVRSEEDLTPCRMLFLRTSERRSDLALVARARRHQVLTIGEGEEFLSAGGHLSLLLEGDRIRFDVNLRTLQQDGLHLSSRVVRLAREVIDVDGQEERG